MSFKGKTHSIETKRKQAISKMGEQNPAKRPEVRKKISTSLKIVMNKPDRVAKMLGDNNVSKRPEVRKKISEAAKQRRHSGEWKLKMGIKNSGENNPNWKGGISCEPYCDVWLDKEYKKFIKERDGYKCLNPGCSKENKTLCIHHINYNKKNCKPNNLITVCKSCNGFANSDREWHQAWYNTIIQKRYGENE